jgi:glycosyltransferase involved in cell wall biosynthesis
MKKVLFVATVVKLHIMVFHLPYLEWFKKNGFEVHVAARNDYENKDECKIPFCDRYYDLPFERSPLKNNNFYVQKKLKKLIEINKYDIIHCHTPIAGALTRLVARKSRKNGTNIIYTAHGFHFYKGAPIKNWLIYYPIEKWLSRYTDVLITINNEDYQRAKKSFKAERVEYIPGVGLDTKKFTNVTIDKSAKRKELGLPEDALVLLSVGELNKNKNHEIVIKALVQLNNSKIHYVICGQGPLEQYLIEVANKVGLDNRVKLLGFRSDIAEICKAADIFAFPSSREGLPVSLMEAMAAGLPVVCSNTRGNTDLIEDGKGGYLVEPDDVEGFAKAINRLILNPELRRVMGQHNLEAVKRFDIDNISKDMARIYQTVRSRR